MTTSAPKLEYDVIVIGAGVAGLAAAQTIQKALPTVSLLVSRCWYWKLEIASVAAYIQFGPELLLWIWVQCGFPGAGPRQLEASGSRVLHKSAYASFIIV